MADITSKLTSSLRTPGQDVGAYVLTKKFSVVSALAADGDYIHLITIKRACRLFQSHLRTSATLGASCTAQLHRNRGGSHTAIGAATTAGAASVVDSVAQGSFDLAVDDIIEVKIAGAAIGASADVEVDLLISSDRAIQAGE